MGLFGFGKKKKKDEADAEDTAQDVKDAADKADDDTANETDAAAKNETDADENEETAGSNDSEDSEDSDEDAEDKDADDSDEDTDDEDSDEDADTDAGENSENEYSDPDEPGPWDYDEDDVDPDFDDRYISFGSVFLPIIAGMTIRARRQQQPDGTVGISSISIEWGKSTLEIVPMAAPKTLSLWDDMADELLTADGATSKEGRFGNEVFLPITVAGNKKHITRIVGADGPRWMLRGIFSGPAANTDEESEDRTTLEDYFARIIVRRGPEPLAPRDVIPILPPKTADQRRAEAKAAADAANKKPDKVKKPKDGPQNYDQEHKVQTTITRGPMFSEVR